MLRQILVIIAILVMNTLRSGVAQTRPDSGWMAVRADSFPVMVDAPYQGDRRFGALKQCFYAYGPRWYTITLHVRQRCLTVIVVPR